MIAALPTTHQQSSSCIRREYSSLPHRASPSVQNLNLQIRQLADSPRMEYSGILQICCVSLRDLNSASSLLVSILNWTGTWNNYVSNNLVLCSKYRNTQRENSKLPFLMCFLSGRVFHLLLSLGNIFCDKGINARCLMTSYFRSW